MFSLFEKKSVVDLTPFIRRLCDLTTPNRPVPDCQRYDLRSNRTLPVLLCPWRKNRPQNEEIEFAITKDISDRGIGLIRRDSLAKGEYVIAFWLNEEMPEPWFFRVTVLLNQNIGGGFWLVGSQLEELLNEQHKRALESLHEAAASLLPPSVLEEASPV